jgi:hypothetical protein
MLSSPRHCLRLHRIGCVAGLVVTATLAAADTPAAEFFRGINLNGPRVEIDGRAWEGKDSRHYETSDKAFENQSVPLVPETDAARATMIRSSRWNNAARIRLTDVPPGRYQVGIYVWEDNNSETFTVSLQGREVAVDVRSGAAGEWRRLGPFVVEVGDDRAILLTTRGGAANLSGIEIWRGEGAVPAPGAIDAPQLPAVAPEVAAHFRTRVAPILSRHCLECHNGSEPRGELNLALWHAALKGGESGPSITPGKPDESLLWQYVESDEMPQDRPPLSAAEKSILRQWIADGAPWGEATIDPFLATTDRRAGYDWWSLQPVQSPQPPKLPEDRWSRNEVDSFVLARLREHGLSPAEETDRRTLIRRVTFDLLGLPPTPDEVDAFLKDEFPRAYERLVDRLLESPHYGERWARHWLDVVRFGESQGFERNHIRENAWRYRDWVIDAFNRNLPYDEFVRRQIAGDVLYPDDLSALIATGYHVCGTWDMVGHNEGTKEMQKSVRQDHLEDLVGALGQTFLGLTLNCARCHDHKFDPIRQEDYYRVAALLGGVYQQPEERSKIELKSAIDSPAVASFEGTAHVAHFAQPATTFVLARGDYRQPRQAVVPAGLSAVDHAGLSSDWGLSLDAPDAERRRKLAEWLADPRNPLTARVFVNRVWTHHFGQGLVDTPSDFGFAGGRPTHPELLDFLARRFMETGWDVKGLHRLIVTSATYRQSSQVESPQAEQIDADNRLLWRANRRRLEGEAVRDAALFVSGALNPKLGGPSFRDVTTARNAKSKNEEFTTPTNEFSEETCRRSIYRLWARSGNHPLMECLDCPDPSVAAPRRAQTITPLQALSLLNNGFMEQCAARCAERVRGEVGGTDRHSIDDVSAQVTQLYRLLFQREPTVRERELTESFVREQGLEQLGLTLFNANEFVYVD